MPIYENREYINVIRELPQFVERDICEIPFIEKNDIDISDINNGKWLVSIPNLSVKDNLSNKKIVQSFKSDDVLRREYYNMPCFLKKVSNYEIVSSFDFTIDKKMDFPSVLSAVYSNRWSGAFVQANGKKAIATVGWIGEKYIDICLAGLRDGAVFLISTIGCNNRESIGDFVFGYNEMRKRFPNSRLICVGNKLECIDSDVIMVSYKDSFGWWNRKNGFWQPSFLDAYGNVIEGGEKDVI